MRILIAEDNPTDRTLLAGLLKPHGDCTVVEYAKDALAAFDAALTEKQTFKLICLDIMLPDQDGKEVLGDMRRKEQEHNVPEDERSVIIMTTGRTDMKSVVSATTMGCDGYLSKPIDKERLFNELAKFNLIPGW